MSRMNEDRVQEALQKWAGASAPPEFVERAVLAEFDRTQSRKRWGRWTVTVAAVAAGLVVAWTGSRKPEIVEPQQQQAEQVFTALPYVVQPAVYERTEVVRLS